MIQVIRNLREIDSLLIYNNILSLYYKLNKNIANKKSLIYNITIGKQKKRGKKCKFLKVLILFSYELSFVTIFIMLLIFCINIKNKGGKSYEKK